jgi:hypothetical protein
MRLVGQSTAANPVFMLGAGRYRVVCEIGMTNIRSERTIALSAGSDVAADITLSASTITLSGLQGSSHASLRDSAGRVVWRSHAGAGFKTLVAPGQYVLALDSGGADVEKPVLVEPNSSLTIDLAAP